MSIAQPGAGNKAFGRWGNVSIALEIQTRFGTLAIRVAVCYNHANVIAAATVCVERKAFREVIEMTVTVTPQIAAALNLSEDELLEQAFSSLLRTRNAWRCKLAWKSWRVTAQTRYLNWNRSSLVALCPNIPPGRI